MFRTGLQMSGRLADVNSIEQACWQSERCGPSRSVRPLPSREGYADTWGHERDTNVSSSIHRIDYPVARYLRPQMDGSGSGTGLDRDFRSCKSPTLGRDRASECVMAAPPCPIFLPTLLARTEKLAEKLSQTARYPRSRRPFRRPPYRHCVPRVE